MRVRKGFSLVELMIVVLILGALAAIAVPRILGGANTAKVNACATNIDLMNSQIELFNANTGGYPADLPTLTGNVAYFPDGAPVCPFGVPYPDALVNNRVDASAHAH